MSEGVEKREKVKAEHCTRDIHPCNTIVTHFFRVYMHNSVLAGID